MAWLLSTVAIALVGRPAPSDASDVSVALVSTATTAPSCRPVEQQPRKSSSPPMLRSCYSWPSESGSPNRSCFGFSGLLGALSTHADSRTRADCAFSATEPMWTAFVAPELLLRDAAAVFLLLPSAHSLRVLDAGSVFIAEFPGDLSKGCAVSINTSEQSERVLQVRFARPHAQYFTALLLEFADALVANRLLRSQQLQPLQPLQAAPAPMSLSPLLLQPPSSSSPSSSSSSSRALEQGAASWRPELPAAAEFRRRSDHFYEVSLDSEAER